ncbi:hypothetical protein BK138_32835 [Paenibacillus rhizosphaerae]|uniref:Uncharacterized protein n=1 Tax=Paenibacillus rhizosphaerae TaxID=297318 RepID=A0A1R1E570_9BACL|nr:hypothetical protein BK138_32835 [Paenibacillus rhizosphaerae]
MLINPISKKQLNNGFFVQISTEIIKLPQMWTFEYIEFLLIGSFDAGLMAQNAWANICFLLKSSAALVI